MGALFRAIRHRLGWRQADLGGRAGVDQNFISRIERGRLEQMPLSKLRRVAHELGAELVLGLRWRGGDLDRLADEGHARLMGRTALLLHDLDWEVKPEVSYSEYGERGSIDLLAWHARSRSLLVVEIKTEVTSIEAMLRKHGEKHRLAAKVALSAFAWRATAVGRVLVLASRPTARRRVARHEAVMESAYPDRGGIVRAWLRGPSGTISGLIFVDESRGSPERDGATSIGRKRIRKRKPKTPVQGPGAADTEREPSRGLAERGGRLRDAAD